MKTNSPGPRQLSPALPAHAAAPRRNVVLSSKSAWTQARRFAVKTLVIVLSAFVLTSCPTPIGTVTNFPRTGITRPWRIATGPDGNLWFTTWNSIGRITPAGVVSNFTGPGISGPQGIAAAPERDR